MATTKRVILSRDEKAITQEINELKALATELNAGHKLVEKFTEGKTNELDIDAVHDYLKEATGFDNPQLTAQLLNKYDDYRDIFTAIQYANLDKAKLLSKRGTQYSLSKTRIAEIEDKYTMYLSSRLEDDYKLIQDIMELAEQLEYRQGIQFLDVNPYQGNKVELKLQAWQSAFLLRGR